MIHVAAAATPKAIGIATATGTWLVSNVLIIAQTDLVGLPQIAVYGVGIMSPIGFGLFLWRSFLKAQNETEAYLKTQVVDLRSENVALRAESSTLRTQLAEVQIELSRANQQLHALNPDLAGRVTALEDNPGETP